MDTLNNMNTLPLVEALMIEFKSDRKYLSDQEIIEVVVGMANTKGRELFLCKIRFIK